MVSKQGQKRALRELFPKYGLEMKYGIELDLDDIFQGRGDGYVLEIGFGSGDTLVQLAQANPNKRFLGVEWHRSSVAATLVRIQGGIIS